MRNTDIQVTWLVVNKVRSASFRLVLHAQQIFASSLNFLVIWGLTIRGFQSTSIFCLQYGTILANTAVLCMRVHIVCRYVAPPDECYYNILLCCDYFSWSSVVSCAFSALWAYLKFGHHPHPLGYLCAKFHFFRDLRYWAGPWKIITYSITHSASLFDAPGTEACTSEYFFCIWNDQIQLLHLITMNCWDLSRLFYAHQVSIYQRWIVV